MPARSLEGAYPTSLPRFVECVVVRWCLVHNNDLHVRDRMACRIEVSSHRLFHSLAKSYVRPVAVYSFVYFLSCLSHVLDATSLTLNDVDYVCRFACGRCFDVVDLASAVALNLCGF